MLQQATYVRAFVDIRLAAGAQKPAIWLLEGSAKLRASTSYDRAHAEGGFWDSRQELYLPENDRYAYRDGLSRGGTMLTVTTEDVQVEKVCDILEVHG